MLSNCGHDEKWQYRGGKAGDQTGTEWQAIPWYDYKSWEVMLRYPNAKVRHWMGDQARAAANNNNIGYDQGQRTTFWNQLVLNGYDASKIKDKCEADCSSGVLSIVKAAGYHFGIEKLKKVNHNGWTGTEKQILVDAGFKAYTAKKYLTSDKYLDNGDILLNEQNHTAFNIDRGSNCDATDAIVEPVKTLIIPDISEHQKNIDWDTLAKHVSAVFLRVAYGTKKLDEKWERNYKACERLGMPYGVYIYSLATNQTMLDKEIDLLLNQIKDRKITYPVYIDLEEKDKANTGYARTAAAHFYKRIKEAGYIPGVYAGLYYYKNYIVGATIPGASLWIAAYGTNNGKPQPNYKPNFPIDAWQYTSVGKLSGISTNVDLNELYVVYDGSVTPEKPDITVKAPTITYAVKTTSGTLPDVQNGTPCGNGKRIVAIKIGVNIGRVEYRVHCGGRWLPKVSGCNWNDFNNGYAGNNVHPIDAIQIYYYSDKAKTPLYEAVYAVKPEGLGYLSEVHDTNWQSTDGDYTAGLFGRPITEIKIKLMEC